tara:strand:- start:399 stop:704 length:306 start_codon:yes stop_codon:yes gene_type:complete
MEEWKKKSTRKTFITYTWRSWTVKSLPYDEVWQDAFELYDKEMFVMDGSLASCMNKAEKESRLELDDDERFVAPRRTIIRPLDQSEIGRAMARAKINKRNN